MEILKLTPENLIETHNTLNEISKVYKKKALDDLVNWLIEQKKERDKLPREASEKCKFVLEGYETCFCDIMVQINDFKNQTK